MSAERKKEYFPWQRDIMQRMASQHLQNSLSHAYIFSGNQGLGKGTFARAFAKTLMCEASGEEFSPCGKCKACLLIESESHPDFKIVSPEDGAKLIKIDQIREINEFMSKSGQQGGRKIVIISPAEKMNINSANALLKTLEEPTGNSLLLLVTHNMGSLLPTIRSRCQVIPFGIPKTEDALGWLKAEIEGAISADGASQADDAIKACLNLASGAPLFALHLLREGGGEVNENMLSGLSKLLKREVNVSDVAASWLDGDIATYLTWMMGWVRQCISYKMTGNSDLIFDPGSRKMLTFLAEKNEAEALFALLDEIQKQFSLVIGSNNPNLQLLLETLLVSWQSLMPRK